MKKLITKKILFLFMLGLFVAIGAKAQLAVPVEGVSLPEAVTMNLGADTTLIAEITPVGATNNTVVWKINEINSSDPDVIEIDTSGVDKTRCRVIAKALGEGVVTVKTYDGNYTAQCTITVVKRVTGIELYGDSIIGIIVGRDSSLKVKIDPFDAGNPAVKWESSDSTIVDIISTEENRTDSTCKILPKKPGTVTIFAKTEDGGFEDRCEITVRWEEIEDFTLNYDDTLLMYVGEAATIIAQIRPIEGTSKFVNWSNTNFLSEDIIEITSSGHDTICTIAARGAGVAEIIAETYDGQKKDTCVVKVEAVKIDTMYMRVDTLYLDNKLHTDAVLIATVEPFTATHKTISFTSNNPHIVEVSSTEKDTICHIRSGYSGEAYIYAVTADGRFKDSCYVRVVVPVDSIVLSATNVEGDTISETLDGGGARYRRINLDLVTDSIAKVAVTVWPDTATRSAYEPLKWRTLDPYLTKDNRPVTNDTLQITALRSGVDTIYVTTADGAVSSDYYFIHIAPRAVDSIKISIDERIVVEDTIYLNVRDSYKLTTTVYPWNATNDTLEWEINEPETGIIRVDSTENGVFLSGWKQGDAILRAKAKDATQEKDSFIVKVRNIPVTGVSLNKDTVRLYENNTDSVIATILPANATNKLVTWTMNEVGVISIEKDADTVCTFKSLKADTAVIHAEIDGWKDSLVVIVKEQFVFVESDTTSTNNGKIALSMKLPDDITLTGSFKLQLPEGFGLTLKEGGGYRTELEAPYKESSDLRIEALNDSTYTFNIVLKASPTSGSLRSAGTKRKVMDIAYTIYDEGLQNSPALYDVSVVNVGFLLSDETEIKEDHSAKIKVYKDATDNEIIGSRDLNIYLIGNRLYVNSAKAETVSVYSLNGSLFFSRDKADGPAVFRIDTQEKVLIVRGSSGWAQKVANQK